MIASTDIIECANCSAEVSARGDTPEQRMPCEKCGSTKRNYHVSISESVVARDGVGVKAKRAGEKRPYIEDMAVPDYSRSLEKLVHRERVIDRDNDRYFEKISDYESGEVIHHCEEPLSQHQGHGNTNPKKGGTDG
jgi:hypothetical protein